MPISLQAAPLPIAGGAFVVEDISLEESRRNPVS